MKNLKLAKIGIFLLLFLCTMTLVFAQALKIDFPKGKLIIDGAANLNIEGYDGTQVIVEDVYFGQNQPNLEEGLTKINSLKEATKMDLEYHINGEELSLNALGRSGRYIIKVPRNLNISCQTKGDGHYYYDGLKSLHFNHIEGEIEVNARTGVDVHVENGSGSISIVTYGNINVEMKSLPKNGALSFDTYLGYVNVSLPETAAASLSLTTKKGDIYTNLPLKKKNNNKNLKKVIATLGGGGIDLMVNAEVGGDIYLRKN